MPPGESGRRNRRLQLSDDPIGSAPAIYHAIEDVSDHLTYQLGLLDNDVVPTPLGNNVPGTRHASQPIPVGVEPDRHEFPHSVPRSRRVHVINATGRPGGMRVARAWFRLAQEHPHSS